MRRFPRHGLPHLMVLFSLSLVFIQGCSRSVLQTYPASDHEIESALDAFAYYQKTSEEECRCCLDAEADATLTVSGWFSDHTGKLSGYLQAMKPGYIKFVSINPLGQPLFIFVTNGNMFQSFNVFEEKAYLGSVHSETYRKFAPSDFKPQFSYYWLTGRLQPGEIKIQAVMRDREQGKFWLQIRHADAGTDSMVLFDPEELVILRHVLRDERGEHLVDIIYADHQGLPRDKSNYTGSDAATPSVSDNEKNLCRVPASISVSSHAGAEHIEFKLSSFLKEVRFSAEDFHLDIPDNFKQLPVK